VADLIGLLPGAPPLAVGIPVADEAGAGERGLALVLGVVERGLSIWAPGDKAAPLCVDFTGGRQGYRLAADRVRHERLIKALGKPKHTSPRVLDLTAGLGRDAALMAAAGFAVTLIERQPVLHALLADGLARAADTPLAQRLTLMPVGEALSDPLPAGPWHALYLDPMFPARDKSAAVKKDLQWLQTLCRYPDLDEERALLALARRQPCDKVIVKRPRRAPPLGGTAPHHSLDGKTVRFDVYLPGG
tara:strand:- start:207 stop:944 length:738 start_codon:yes stop_codon:yes gene_type:complete